MRNHHARTGSRVAAAMLTLSTATAGLPASAAPAAQAADTPVFQVQTSSVLLDLVVRDKKGKLVRDLTAEDLSLIHI